jgi:hypothetical protein
MATAGQGASSGGWVSTAIVVVLLLLAIGLYLQIVMVERDPGEGRATPQASLQAGGADVPGPTTQADPATPPSVPVAAEMPRDLPEDQMELIKQVFAPELIK